MNSTVYYHYTNLNACLGIVASHRIWFTDYRFLNDKYELKQGVDNFLLHIPEYQRSAFTSAFEWYNMSSHHCVLSLSRSPKILSQWRAYGADGTGVAIGFSEQFLKFSEITLINCQYENHVSYAQALAQKYAQFIELVYQAQNTHVAGNDFMGWVEEQRNHFDSIVRDLIALKNPAFAEEQEVRAIRSLGHGMAKLRVSGNVMIPYTEVNFWDNNERQSSMAVVIPEIWLGPKCNELNRIAIYALDMGFCRVHRYDCGYV